MNTIRDLVKEMYPNPRWAHKVDQMDDDQVYAILMSKKEVKQHEEREIPVQDEPFEQGRLF